MLLAIGFFLAVQTNDVDVAALLREKGAKVTELKGVPTGKTASKDDRTKAAAISKLNAMTLVAGRPAFDVLEGAR